MADFKPSDNFIFKTMEGIRSYEKEKSDQRDRVNAVLLSGKMRFAISLGAILFAILNLIRMASILISPAVCM